MVKRKLRHKPERDESLHSKSDVKKIPIVTVELIIVRLNRYLGLCLPKARVLVWKLKFKSCL